MSAAIDLHAALTTGVTELVAAASEYMAVSRPLSEQCEPAQTRLEHALSVFGGAHPFVQAEEIRGMAGRIRELESDLETLSREMQDYVGRFERINTLLRAIGDFAVGEAPDPVDTEVGQRLAEQEATKGRKRGAK